MKHFTTTEDAGIGSQRTDRELLEVFVRSGDQEAFKQIVQKYSRLAYSAALRRCGQRELAEEAMQNAFAILARKGRHLLKHPTLSGWLHRTAMLEASTLLRSERTRHRKHAELMERETSNPISPPVQSGSLDEALARLGAPDRDVILMRFYEGLSFDEIAQRLGKSNAACQKRSFRAVGKLSQLLAKGGAPTASSAAIALALSSQLAEASPLATSGVITKLAISKAPETAVSALVTNALNTMNSTKTISSAAITLALLIPIGLQSKEATRLEREMADIRNQLAELQQPETRLSSSPTALTAMRRPAKPGSPEGVITKEADDDAAIEQRDRQVKAFGNLKREEIFYNQKYAEGVPGPDDPNYADYIAEMDGFLRLVAKEMMVISNDESAPEIKDPIEQAAMVSEVLKEAIGLDDATGAIVSDLLTSRFQEFGEQMLQENTRPSDPDLLRTWNEGNERMLGSTWDEVHALLSPEEQRKLEIGFSRSSIVGRVLNLGFPGGLQY